MAPPPSTPTPHRFLVPKRSATQRSDTPNPLPAGAQQFHATPRFSLHSTPREPPAPSNSSSTPARPAAFVRQRNADTISDAIDSSPPVPQPSPGLHDSIEVDSIPPSSAFPSSDHGIFFEESGDEEGPSSPKRRRISLSTERNPESSRPLADQELTFGGEEQHEPSYSDQAEEVGSDTPDSPKATSVQQPRFQRAPRFKPVDHPEESHHEPLPDAFSPHRRGAKYVPGGLAAELRDWLVDVEASTGAKRDGDFVAKISIDQVRYSPGVVLTEGRRGIPPNENDATVSRDVDPGMKIILAGEGRLAGLTRRTEVTVGSVVGIAKPVWEVNLGTEGRWVVACDWVVL